MADQPQSDPAAAHGEASEPTPPIIVTPSSPPVPRDVEMEDELSIAEKKRNRRRTRRTSKSRADHGPDSDQFNAADTASIASSMSADNIIEDIAPNSTPRSEAGTSTTSTRHKRHLSQDKILSPTGARRSSSSHSHREHKDERSHKDREGQFAVWSEKEFVDRASTSFESAPSNPRGIGRKAEIFVSMSADNVPSAHSSTAGSSLPTATHRRKSSSERGDAASASSKKYGDVPALPLVPSSPRSPRDGDLLPSTPRTAQPGTLTIYLGKGQIHSTYLHGSRSLRHVLLRLSEHRTDLMFENRIPRDMDGNILDMDKPLSELGVTEVRFTADIDIPGGEAEEDKQAPASPEVDLDLELMNKMQSLDAANIETIDEFVQGGHLMAGDVLDFGQDENADDNGETFTRRKLKEIEQRLRDKDTGVPVRNRKLRLRWFDNCFVASEAVKWMQDQLNITKEEAIALGRGLEREGFISHVTLRHNFDDSSSLLFRFAEDASDLPMQSPTSAGVESGIGLGLGAAVEESSESPSHSPLPSPSSGSPPPQQLTSAQPRTVGPMTSVRKLTKIFDTLDLGSSGYHQQFWNVQPPPQLSAGSPSLRPMNADPRSLTAKRRSLKTNMLLHALSSYVPNVVLRRFAQNPSRLEPPEVESYPASLLFADISGFTPLTEKLAQLGSRGVEQLTQYLNEYFGQMISIIFNHGGDIVKFAGDALLAIWPTSSEMGLAYSSAIAAQCALTMQEHLHEWDADGVPLTLHIGVGAGKIHGLHVGGVANRMEFLIAGAPLEQAAHCEEAAKSGEVFISKEAAILLRESVELSIDKSSTSKGKVKTKKVTVKPDLMDGFLNYRLERILEPVPLPPSNQLPTVSGMKKLISPYVQPAVLGHLKSGSPDHFLAELRTVSVIFVNLSMTYSPEQMERLQAAVRMMQEAVYSFEGTIRQFIIDDKGSVLIAAFGLPPLSHEDDPARATRAAMFMQKNLKEMKIGSSIGVTTGKAFCGAVGSEERREYAMVGDIVNLSARLMAKAAGGILCDSTTYMASRSRVSFKTLPSITVKGKSMAIEVFSPQREVQSEHSNAVRRPEKFGSMGRAMLLKSKLRTSASKLTVDEPLVGRQSEWKRITEILSRLAADLEAVAGLDTPPTSARSDAADALSGAGSPRLDSARTSDADRSSTSANALEQLFQHSDSPPQTSEPPAIVVAPVAKKRDSDKKKGKKSNKSSRSGTPEAGSSSTGAKLSPIPEHPTLARTESMRDVSTGDAQANIIFIQGEAGYGKSKLLNEVLLLAQKKRIRTVVGSAYSVESSTTYYAWRDIFSSIFDLDRHVNLSNSQTNMMTHSTSTASINDSRGSAPERSEKVLERLMQIAPDMMDYAPLLTAILPQLDIPDNEKTTALTGQLRAAKTIQICVKVLVTSPYKMFVLDNAHWLDSASWALALAAAQQLSKVALLFCMRPLDEASSVEYKKLIRLAGMNKIELRPLNSAEVEQLIAAKLEVKFVPPEVVQIVVDKGSGNPLMISELVDALRHSGRIEVTPQGECKVSKQFDKQLSTLGIPDTLRGLITSKIDRLTQSQQMILKVACVIGRVFPIDIAQELMASLSSTGQSDEDQIMADLVTLEAMDFISLKSEEPLSYTFKQNLAQEVVYDLMLWSQRRGLHEKVAEWYESHESEQGTAYSLLAHHWKEADNVEKAILYYSKSGEQALANCANREAVSFFTECIELQGKQLKQLATGSTGSNSNLLEPLSARDSKARKQEHMWQLLSWQRQLGQAYYGLGLLDKAAEHLEAALVLMNEPVKPSEASHLLSKLKVKTSKQLPHIDLKLVKTASTDSVGLSTPHSSRGNMSFRETSSISSNSSATSTPTTSKKRFYGTSSSSQAVQTREYILILLTLGKVNYYACKKDVVTYCNLLALKKAEELGVSRELSEATGNAIITCGMHGKHELAEAYVISSTELAMQFLKTDPEPYMNVMQMCGLYFTGVANWKKSEECFEKCIKLASDSGNARRLEECLIHLSTCQFLQGKIRESLQTNEKAVESARRRGDIQSQVLVFTAQARNQVALGQMQTAMQTLEAVESFVGKSDGYKLDVASEIIYHALLALIHLYQKDYELAYRTAETVLTFLEQSEPTAAFTFSGFMLVPEVFLSTALMANRPNSQIKLRIQQKQLMAKVDRALSNLAKFAKIFTFAEPRLLLWQGVYEQLAGKPDRALTKWRQSLQMSRGLGMLYDEGMALLRIGKCTDVKDSREVVEEKLRNYDRALDLFTQLGAFYTELPSD